ncbi:hypothetical protein AAVH_22167 [Aphelenchoides avenae]|nr:hypothetical protein AAVH_22167 [Aphelenchus avenae]
MHNGRFQMFSNAFRFDDSDDDDPRQRTFRLPSSLDGHNDASVKRHFRLSRASIESLAQRFHAELSPKYAERRADLSPVDKLVMALHYFTTGDQYNSIAEARGVTKKTVSVTVDKVTQLIISIGA